MPMTILPNTIKPDTFVIIATINHQDTYSLSKVGQFHGRLKEITLVGLMDVNGNPPQGVTFIREGTSDKQQGYYSVIRTWPEIEPLARIVINNKTKQITTAWENPPMTVDLEFVCHVLIDSSEPGHDNSQTEVNGV